MIHQSAYGAEPWWLRESELNLDVLAQSESVFALSNGHIGWRANLDGTYGYFEQALGNQRRIMSRGLSSGGDRVRCGEGTEQLPGGVALERSHDLLRGAAFGSSARDVSAGGRIDAHADDGDRRERDPDWGCPVAGLDGKQRTELPHTTPETTARVDINTSWINTVVTDLPSPPPRLAAVSAGSDQPECRSSCWPDRGAVPTCLLIGATSLLRRWVRWCWPLRLVRWCYWTVTMIFFITTMPLAIAGRSAPGPAELVGADGVVIDVQHRPIPARGDAAGGGDGDVGGGTRRHSDFVLDRSGFAVEVGVQGHPAALAAGLQIHRGNHDGLAVAGLVHGAQRVRRCRNRS